MEKNDIFKLGYLQRNSFAEKIPFHEKTERSCQTFT